MVASARTIKKLDGVCDATRCKTVGLYVSLSDKQHSDNWCEKKCERSHK